MTGAQTNPLVRKLARLYPLESEEEVALLAAFARTVQVAADQDIIREGDRPSECNLLLEGMTCRYKIMEDGRRQIFSFHIPGDIYDAQSFLLDTMDHSVATLTPCSIAVIPHAAITRITEEFPRIARAIWKDTLVDAAMFREWIANIGRRSAYQRVAHIMCEIFARCEGVGLNEGDRIVWPITQHELGDALGLSLVHINRTLQQLRKAGLITLKDTVLTVRDWDGLRSAGQFDPAYLHLKAEPARSRTVNGYAAAPAP